MQDQQPVCIHCERTAEEVPLINMRYQGRDLWICPQHLPILIHKPAQLEGKLPGASRLGPSEGHDH